MQTIEVDDDIYQFLEMKIIGFLETPNSVLRRELGLDKVPAQPQNPGGIAKGQLSPLEEFVSRPDFPVYADVISKYLDLLSWLYKRDPDRFKGVVNVSGRKRKYFALSSQDLDSCGNSVMPKRIPNSPFWAASNSSTTHKRKIIKQVMHVLGYGGGDISIALSVLK